MKTNFRLYIWWSVLSLFLLGSAADTYDSPSALRRRKIFKLGAPKPVKLDRKSTQRFPGSPPSTLRSQPGAFGFRSGFAYLPDVSVTCSASDFVVRVKPAFYGLGADAEELRLGGSCQSNGVLRPYGDLLFTYPLTHCEVQRELPPGFLVYKFVLHYEPSPRRFPRKAHRMDVDIECRFQRYHHVHQLAVQPTWQTAVLHKRLSGRPSDFQIQLMDDSWSRPAESQVYQLGQVVNFQVSAPHTPAGGKLYINSCYATPSNGTETNLKYAIIDNFGCMLDSQRDPGASRFISRTDKTLRFSLIAFQFSSDPDAEVHIQCKLFVTSEDPSPVQKSCTYRDNRWMALKGDDSICACCDSQCVTSKARRAMMEGSASSGPLLVSDQPNTQENDFLPIGPSPVSIRRHDELEVWTKMSHQIDDLYSHENQWETTDMEEDDDDDNQKIYKEDEGMETEPQFDTLDFRTLLLVEDGKESGMMDEKEFGDDGSGYYEHIQGRDEESNAKSEREVSDLRVAEESEDEIYDVKQLAHVEEEEDDEQPHRLIQLEELSEIDVGLQREVQPLEEEKGKNTGRGEENEWTMARKNDLSHTVDDTETTWYFTWR